MDADMVQQVRRFNRAVTQRVGALNDRFLAGERPLAEARLLWEIGPEGSEIRALRARLDLDSGHASRLLRSLEADGVVTVAEGNADRRVRTARLTPAGVAEREVLERRSDELAESFLAPLSDRQRDRLTAAMQDVERLLTASLVELRPVDPEHPDAVRCIAAYVEELNRRADRPFDPEAGVTAAPAEVRPPAGLLLLAYLRSDPVGCGALKHHAGAPSDIKRMWVSEDARGLGLGRRLLGALEAEAARRRAPGVRLDTNKALVEAIGLYRSSGYEEAPRFNDEPFADHWFEKRF
jgi:DNA-binding MarR family transcriptional regulator/GNAT superfamily N-acetyltransferase